MGSEVDQRGREQSPQTEDSEKARRQREVDAAQRLQQIATQSIDGRGVEALYEQILDTAMAILHSDFASMQMFHPERGAHGELNLIGHRGFSRAAVERWEWVRPDMCTSCGEALRTGR